MNERVKNIRKALKLTQTEFGERLGVSGSAITYIEKGKRKLTDQMAKAILREFDVSPLYLNDGIDPMFNLPDDRLAFMAAGVVSGKNDTAKAFLKIIATLSPDELTLLEKVIKRVAKELPD